MDGGIKIGTIWGIPIRLHGSWFIIFFLVSWSLASGYLPQQYPQLSAPALWLLGALTSLLFAISVVLHELGHSYFALRERVPVHSVTLFIFGGVAHIGKEPSSAGAEFRIAIAGPLTSLFLAGFFGLLWLLDRPLPYLAAPSEWLARINLTLAVFNLIPGFPLDGGRVLRAVIWRLSNDPFKATRWASISGQLVAFGFIGWGIFSIFGGNFFNGLWLIFIGWFLQNAAASTYAQTSMQHALRGVRVSQVMNHNAPIISPDMLVGDLIEQRVLNGGQRAFLVTGCGRENLCGVVTLREMGALPQNRWYTTPVGDVMVPYERLVLVSPDAPLLDALQKMDDADVAQMPVVQGNMVLGILTRDQILRYLRVRAEIGV